jgi:hypothetical protein
MLIPLRRGKEEKKESQQWIAYKPFICNVRRICKPTNDKRKKKSARTSSQIRKYYVT